MISVLLPAYNEEEFIAEAVQSILDQSHIDFELIIINNASTDNTLKILESFNDNRIIIINNEKNYGLSKSLNIGFAKSKGEFIARMDANDIAYPSRFVEQYNFFSNHPKAVAVFCPVEKINKDGVSLNRVEGKYIPSEELQTYLFYKNVNIVAIIDSRTIEPVMRIAGAQIFMGTDVINTKGRKAIKSIKLSNGKFDLL